MRSSLRSREIPPASGARAGGDVFAGREVAEAGRRKKERNCASGLKRGRRGPLALRPARGGVALPERLDLPAAGLPLLILEVDLPLLEVLTRLVLA